MKTALLLPGILAFGTAITLNAAEGLRSLPDSAEAIGSIGGRFTLLDDPSVVRANPASLTRLSDPALQINFQSWHGDTDYERFGGASDSMIKNWKYLGGINYVHPINEKLTVGLGISAPFGLSINWEHDGLFKYIAPNDALLQTISIAPAFGYQVNDRLSFGLGLDIFYSELVLEQAFPWAVVAGSPVPDGNMRFKGDGWGLGGFVGLNYEPVENHRFALVARLPVSVDYGGDFSVTNIPTSLAGTFTSESAFSSEIEYPGSIGLGYSYQVNKQLALATDVEWIQNSTHDDLPLNIDSNQGLLGGAQGIDLQWKDSFSVGFGAEYKATENVTLRAGYLYSQSPLKNSTYIPSVPSNDRHIFSVGIGYTKNKNTVDFSYAYMHMESLSVTGSSNPRYDGNYDFGWHVLALSYTRKF